VDLGEEPASWGLEISVPSSSSGSVFLPRGRLSTVFKLGNRVIKMGRVIYLGFGHRFRCRRVGGVRVMCSSVMYLEEVGGVKVMCLRKREL